MKNTYRSILFSDINNLEESSNTTYNSYAELYRKLYKKIRRKYEIPKFTQHIFSTRINMNSIFYSVINIAINEYNYVKSVSEDVDAFLDHHRVFLLIKKNLGNIHTSLVKYLNIERKKRGKFRIYEHKEKEIKNLVNKILIDVETFLNKKTMVYRLKTELKKNAGKDIPGLDLVLMEFLERYKKSFSRSQVIYEKDVKEIENQNIIVKQKSMLDTEKIKTEALTQNYVETEKDKIKLQKKLKNYKETIKFLRSKYKKRNEIFNRTKRKNRLLNERLEYLNKELDNIENYDSYSKSTELLRRKIDFLNDELMKYREGKEKYKRIRRMETDREDLRALLGEKLIEIDQLRLASGQLESDQVSTAQYKRLYEMYAPKVRELETAVKELDERLVMIDRQYLSLNNELDFKVNTFILKKFTDEQLKNMTTINEKRLNLENLKKLTKIYEKYSASIDKKGTLRGKMIEAYVKNTSPENGVDMFKVNLKEAMEKREQKLKKAIKDPKIEAESVLKQSKIGSGIGTGLGLLFGTVGGIYGGPLGAITAYRAGDSLGNLGYDAYNFYSDIQKDKSMRNEYTRQMGEANVQLGKWRKEVKLMEVEKSRIEQDQKQEEWNEGLRWAASKVTHGMQIPVTWKEAKMMGYAKLLSMPLNLWNKRKQRLQNEKKSKELEEYMKKDAYTKIMDLAISDRNLSLMFFREDPIVTRAFQLLTEKDMTISLEDVNRSFLDFIRVAECHIDIRRSMKLRILDIFRRRKKQYLFLKSKLETCDIFQFVVAYVLLSRNFRKYYVDVYGFNKKDLITVVYVVLNIFEDSRSTSMEDLRNDLTFVDKIDYVNERGFYTKEKTVFELVYKRAGSFYEKIMVRLKKDELTYENYHVNKKTLKQDDHTTKLRMEIIIRRIVNMEHFNLSRLMFFASPLFSFLERFTMFHVGSEDDMAKMENIFGDGVNIFSENEQDKLISLTSHKNKITDVVDSAGELNERYRDIDASIFVNLVVKQKDALKYSIKNEKEIELKRRTLLLGGGEDAKTKAAASMKKTTTLGWLFRRKNLNPFKKPKKFVARIPKNGVLWMVLMIVNSIKGDINKILNLESKSDVLSPVEQAYKDLTEYSKNLQVDKVFIPSMKMLLLSKNFVSFISLLKYFLNALGSGDMYNKLFGVSFGMGIFCTQKILQTANQKSNFKSEKMKKLVGYSGEEKLPFLEILPTRWTKKEEYVSKTLKCKNDDTILVSEEVLLETGIYVLVKAKRGKSYISAVSPDDVFYEYFGRTYELHCFCYYDYKNKMFVFYDHMTGGSYKTYYDHTTREDGNLDFKKDNLESDEQTDYIFFIYKLKEKIKREKEDEMKKMITDYEKEEKKKTKRESIKVKSKIGSKIGNKMELLKKTEDVKDNLEKKIEEERFRKLETDKSRVIAKSKNYNRRIKKYRDENKKHEKQLMTLSIEIQQKRKLFNDGVNQLIKIKKKESKEYQSLNNDMSVLNTSVLRLSLEEDNIKTILKENNEKITKYAQKRKRLEEKNEDTLERIVKMRETEERRKIELNEKRIRGIQERERLKEKLKEEKDKEKKRLDFEKKQKEKRIRERKKEIQRRYEQVKKLKERSDAIRRKQERDYKKEQEKLRKEQERIARDQNRERRQIARQETAERQKVLRQRKTDNDKKLRTLNTGITREKKNINSLEKSLKKLDFDSFDYRLKKLHKGFGVLDRFGSRGLSTVEAYVDQYDIRSKIGRKLNVKKKKNTNYNIQ